MSLPFNPKEGLIVVPTHLWGPTGDTIGRMALDTGATISMISLEIAKLLGYDLANVAERVRITTGSSIVELAPLIRVQSIQALQREHRNFPLVCHTLPGGVVVDGVLGLDFFRGWKLILDFQ